MAITVVQTAKGNTGTASVGTATATFAAATTAGNALIALFATGSTNATFTPDSADTWTSITGGMVTATYEMQAYYVASCVGGKTGYTFTRSSNGQAGLVIIEVSGLTTTTPLDKQASATNTTAGTGTVTTGTTATTAQADELWVACVSSAFTAPNAGTGYTSPTTGFSLDGETSSSSTTGGTHNVDPAIYHEVVSATGTATFSATIAAATNEITCAGIIATFKAAASSDPFPAGYGHTRQRRNLVIWRY